jgi:hypothetical protein
MTLMAAVLSSPVASFAVILPPASVSLGWDASPGNYVAGYRVYYGPSSGNYTNSVNVGNVTSSIISGLANGAPYFFTVTAYNVNGVESVFSNEISFTPGAPTIRLQLASSKQVIVTVSGLAGHTYEILATQNFTSWRVIGTTTLGIGGSFDFIDTNAVNFPKRFYRIHEKL